MANQHVQRAQQSLSILKARTSSVLLRKVSEWHCEEALRDLEKTGKARALNEGERSLVLSEHSRLSQELARYVSQYSGRDPFRSVNGRKRKDIEELVRLIFERIGNKDRAEDLAKRILNAFR
jgi:hypothetical protein